jgi:hypothetical protein
MKRTLKTPVLVFASLIALASVTIAQKAEKGWEKTVTLSSGEVILDMSGEWNFRNEFYGPFYWVEPTEYTAVIKQEGASFIGVTPAATKWRPKGSETIKGELDKDGFKQVYKLVHEVGTMDDVYVWELCNWEISEHGNKVMLDCGERIKSTVSRK